MAIAIAIAIVVVVIQQIIVVKLKFIVESKHFPILINYDDGEPRIDIEFGLDSEGFNLVGLSMVIEGEG
jgi:hypothetical protein